MEFPAKERRLRRTESRVNLRSLRFFVGHGGFPGSKIYRYDYVPLPAAVQTPAQTRRSSFLRSKPLFAMIR